MGTILVVFTGGTIGSQVQDSSIVLQENKGRYALLEAYEAKYPGRVHFEAAKPFQISSENMQIDVMAELAYFLRGKDLHQYEGVIVTHGTDSLPYTAAFLGYFFAAIQIPLLLVSSNYALGEPGSNGQANFEAAVDFICEGRYAGVFVPFKNQEEMSLFLATRLLEADSYGDEFSSYDKGRLGRIEDGRFVYENRKTNPPLEAFLKREGSQAGRGREGLKAEMQDISRVLKLHPYPGFRYDSIQLNQEIKAVFHGVYHSGTVCAEGGEENAELFVKRAEKKGIPVYFGPIKKQENQYISTKKMILAGGIPIYDCSEIAAYVKLVIGCSQGKQGEELKEFMQSDIYFEQVKREEGPVV